MFKTQYISKLGGLVYTTYSSNFNNFRRLLLKMIRDINITEITENTALEVKKRNKFRP